MNLFKHNIQFERPEFLTFSWIAVTVIGLLVLFGFINLLLLRRSYAQEENMKRTTRTPKMIGGIGTALGYGLVAFLLMCALADPYEDNQPTMIPAGSVNLVGAFDVSNSMAAEDYRELLPTPALADGTHPAPIGPWGSRLAMARALFTTQVMNALPGNEIGVAVYTADPWPISPLNRDYSTLRRMLATGWLRIGGAPGGGSDFIEGLRISVETLRQDYDPKKRQIIVLFSDGGVNLESEKEKQEWAESYENAVKEVKALKAEVIVVGLGSKQPQLVPIYHPQTLQRVGWFPLAAPENKKETTAVDTEALRKLADRVGGKFVYIDPQSEASLNIDWVNTIGGTRESQGKFYWTSAPLLAAMVCFCLLMLRALIVRRSANTPSRFS
jgi:hypothetical protein